MIRFETKKLDRIHIRSQPEETVEMKMERKCGRRSESERKSTESRAVVWLRVHPYSVAFCADERPLSSCRIRSSGLKGPLLIDALIDGLPERYKVYVQTIDPNSKPQIWYSSGYSSGIECLSA